METIIKSYVTSDHFPIFATEKKVGTEKMISKNLILKFKIPFPLELHILRKALVILYTIKYDDMMILYMIKYDDIMILRYDYMPHNSPVANLLHLLPYKIIKIFGKIVKI